MRKDQSLLAYVLLSFTAAVLLLVMVRIESAQPSTTPLLDKAVVSSAFMASCVAGIVLSAKPGFLRGKGKGPPIDRNQGPGRPRYVAHHPDCGSFDERVVVLRGRKYCGGCLGLMVGSITALALTVIYFFALDVSADEGWVAFLAGLAIVALGLVEIASKRGTSWSHLLANALLVVGFFMVTIGALSSTGSGTYGLVALIVCFLWLDTRIQISDWRHAGTCASCGRTCGFY
ncbi:MAG TPA: hypothetical protein VLU38_07425 [Methanomassiliicoccales archaeon]|nr:hypothetical protein [Methanomassiliicoccales archaeon]